MHDLTHALIRNAKRAMSLPVDVRRPGKQFMVTKLGDQHSII
jgi:hypothetical protein